MFTRLRAAAQICLVVMVLAVASRSGEASSPVDLEKAPPFSAMTLSGQAVTYDSLRGDKHYVVLVFFGVSCTPCQKKIAQLNELWRDERFRDKARVYAVNSDGLSTEKLAEEMTRRKISIEFPVIPDPGQAITNLYVNGIIPLTVVIDNQDRIVMTTLGARPETVRKLVDRIISEQEASAR